jgi:hypothetical protein
LERRDINLMTITCFVCVVYACSRIQRGYIGV